MRSSSNNECGDWPIILKFGGTGKVGYRYGKSRYAIIHKRGKDFITVFWTVSDFSKH